MGDARRACCKRCGKHRDQVGTISWRGKCKGCAVILVEENLTGLHDPNSAEFAHWKARTLAAFGVGILDDAPSRGQTRDHA